MKNKIVAIVQARMGASRLPNKMMLHLNGYPIIEWIYRRVSRSKSIDALVFAISDLREDDVLSEYLESIGANVFRGSEQDVLSRVYEAAKEFQASHFVRICADNPVVCPEAIDDLIDFYFNNECDYAYNHIPKGNKYPDGLGAEMISFELLANINEKADKESQREHALNYIWDNQEKFSIKTFDPKNNNIAKPDLKLDIDTSEDYLRFIKQPIDPDMPTEEIVELFGGVK